MWRQFFVMSNSNLKLVFGVQDLREEDYPRRRAFCENFLRRVEDDPELPSRVIFSDESLFTRDGIFNCHNMHAWNDENPHVTRLRNFQVRWKFNVWAGIFGTTILGPVILPDILNGVSYVEFLSENLPDFLEDVPLADRNKIIFQQDGAGPHNARVVTNFLNEQFPDRWMGRYGPIRWPARSPDLNPLDFFLWGHCKEIIYRKLPENETQDEQLVIDTNKNVTNNVIHNSKVENIVNIVDSNTADALIASPIASDNDWIFSDKEVKILLVEDEKENEDKGLTFNEIGETPQKKQKLSFFKSQEYTNSDELQANKLENKISIFKEETKRTDCSTDNNYDLERILKNSVKGHSVLSAYQFQGELDEKHRNILADIIVHHELKDNLNARVTSERAEFIAEKIINLFPKEEKDTWILREKNKKGKSVGRGKILIKFQTIRRNLIKSGAITVQIKKEQEREETDDCFEGDTDYEQYILWLQNNDTPWIKVTQLWEKTSKIRLKSLRSDNQSIQDYIRLYSALEASQGYTLVRV
ncbi:uncharacterized protein LOC120358566 [Solenopsis invicta]|uniref:uncharacterized protein LOC120358566 n=1 Tax=Solenopsis invicta TaxID=13686 RepID=UPI00193EACF2|nr:uncharacterized protein LOC120358566 [Solenopsis invicta]